MDFKPYEAKDAKEHGLTPTQFSVLETLYSKENQRIQDLIGNMLATLKHGLLGHS